MRVAQLTFAQRAPLRLCNAPLHPLHPVTQTYCRGGSETRPYNRCWRETRYPQTSRKSYPFSAPASTSIGWMAARAVVWSICSRQEVPVAQMMVSRGAARTAGASAISASDIDSS